MITFPNAKINLGLKILEKREDGYHNIETLFYPVDLCDVLDVVVSDKFWIDISGMVPEGNKEDNLVVKAYNLLKQDFKLSPVHIHLHKKIPAGAGLGGGSSDAAFMLKILNNLFSLELDIDSLEKYASMLGADCPFFIKNKPAFATGIGNVFSALGIDLSEYKILIIKPPVSVNTSEAYKNINPFIPEKSLKEFIKTPIIEWRDKIVNDFEEPVFKLYPEIQNIKLQLYNQGAVFASMSGSGSAVYGIFRDLPINLEAFTADGCFIYR